MGHARDVGDGVLHVDETQRPGAVDRRAQVATLAWALLAVLGVPIWLLVGLLTAVLVARRRFQAQSDVICLELCEPDAELLAVPCVRSSRI